MLDQYGEAVPKNLVAIPDIDELVDLFSQAQVRKIIKRILEVPWYEFESNFGNGTGWIFISQEFVPPEFSNDWYTPEDLNQTGQIYRITENLYRWNFVDGFFHA